MKRIGENVGRFWKFLNEDSWQSWLVSLVLAFVIIKFIFFPAMSLATGSSLPLVVVESCSMYHTTSFYKWYEQNGLWYENKKLNEDNFTEFPFKNGLNKGDIILVYNRGNFKVGDIIIFSSDFAHPLIHRVVEKGNKIGTKGDNNFDQLEAEKNINSEDVLGRAIVRIPGLGWIKLIFFEGSRSESQRGFCK